jgi:hypothetical protein
MADIVLQHAIGALGSLRLLSSFAALTAGGAGNNVAVTGITLDREAFAGGSLPNSSELALLFSTTLAAGKTLSLGYSINSSQDGATWTLLVTGASAVVATGPAGGGTVTGQLTIPVDLTSGGRFVQIVFTPALNNTATDTATVVAAGFFAGFDRLPAPA